MTHDIFVGVVDPVVAVGIDTHAVADSARAYARFGDDYLRRVCSPAEQRALPVEAGPRVRALATLWAAKEATTKTLAPASSDSWPWPAVEIDLDAGAVRLHGRPGELAADAGIERVVVAACDGGDPVHTSASRPRHNDRGTSSPGHVTLVALALAAPTPQTRHPHPKRTS